MDEDTIPLYDGEPTGATIHFDRDPADAAGPAGENQVTNLISRRPPRHGCERILVCFSPETADGRIDNVECPVINISKGGFALEYDRPLQRGRSCMVSYRTISQQPVHVSGSIRHCEALGNDRYKIGVKLARALKQEELKPAKHRPGRDVAPGIRARQLCASAADGANSTVE